MMACCWLSGRQPFCNDALHISILSSNNSIRNILCTTVGSGSRLHDLDGAPIMIDLTSSIEHGWKRSKATVAPMKLGRTITTSGSLRYCGHLRFKEISKLLCWRTILWRFIVSPSFEQLVKWAPQLSRQFHLITNLSWPIVVLLSIHLVASSFLINPCLTVICEARLPVMPFQYPGCSK